MALKANQVRMVEGDTLPTMTGKITDDDGNPSDITGYSLSLHIKYDIPLIVPITITDATLVEYASSTCERNCGQGCQ